MLYTMTHLRGRLHITMRDLRSALSFMLIGNRDCAEMHALYASGQHGDIARSYYFNSWMGGGQPTADRLLSLLAELDVGRQEDPRFDRGLDFVQPDDRALFRFERRGNFDFEVLKRLFEDLPRGVSEGIGTPAGPQAIASTWRWRAASISSSGATPAGKRCCPIAPPNGWSEIVRGTETSLERP